eukprot:2057042-Rhodomonas_salina.2
MSIQWPSVCVYVPAERGEKRKGEERRGEERRGAEWRGEEERKRKERRERGGERGRGLGGKAEDCGWRNPRGQGPD